jgi:O-antigen/teichoic acid export membrane protein
VTPYQIATQFLILPMAVAAVLFPLFASLWEQDRERLRLVYRNAVHVVFGAMLAAAALVVAIAPELLSGWLGERFVAPSTAPLRWLIAGVMMNGVAHVPFAFIQSAGRSDWTAKLHLAEAPLYAAALVLSARRFGLTGVAIVWSLRTTLDLIALYVLAAGLAGLPARARIREVVWALGGLASLAVIAWPEHIGARAGLALVVMVGCAVALYRQAAGLLRARRLEPLATIAT